MNTNPLTLTAADFKAQTPEVQALYYKQFYDFYYKVWVTAIADAIYSEIRYRLIDLPPIIDKAFYEGLDDGQKALYQIIADDSLQKMTVFYNEWDAAVDSGFEVWAELLPQPSPAVPVQPQEEKREFTNSFTSAEKLIKAAKLLDKAYNYINNPATEHSYFTHKSVEELKTEIFEFTKLINLRYNQD